MAKVLRIPSSDYKIVVGEGNTITLDTTNALDNGTGKVVITGDLEVKGDTISVESTVVSIEDNIIVLSSGNTGNGLPASLDIPYSSGIEIERGNYENARWVYDDSISWSLGAGVTGLGTWTATRSEGVNEETLPLATPGIVAGGNFYVNVGAGVISVEGSSSYEEKVFRYDSGAITPDPLTGSIIVSDDAIPNAKAVRDFVDYSFTDIGISAIIQDNSSVEIIDPANVIASIAEVGSRTTLRTVNSHGYEIGDTIVLSNITTSPTDAIIDALNGSWTVTDVPTETTIEINVSTTGADENNYVVNSGRANPPEALRNTTKETRVAITIEGSEVAGFYRNRAEFSNLEFRNGEIVTTESDSDLVIGAPGTGVVRIKDVLELSVTPSENDARIDPLAPDSGVKIYSKAEGPGNTGIYFNNSNETNDEIISKNRALLYSMLF